MKHTPSNTEIYYTTEYANFKWLKGNRDLNEAKIKKILKAIESGVNVLKYAPIIVNENMEIIDGQHRFTVAKQLQTNVYYVIHPDADLSIVPTINSNSSRWKTADFLNSYCDLGKPAYIELLKFIDQYPKTRLPTAAKIFHSGKAANEAAIEAFKDGQLKTDHKELAYELADLLTDFTDHMDNPYSSRMYAVMLQLKDNGKYDHQLMLRKLKESGRRIEKIDSVKTIIEDMESIINHRTRNRITIY